MEKICGKGEFWVWNETVNAWWRAGVVSRRNMNWRVWHHQRSDLWKADGMRLEAEMCAVGRTFRFPAWRIIDMTSRWCWQSCMPPARSSTSTVLRTCGSSSREPSLVVEVSVKYSSCGTRSRGNRNTEKIETVRTNGQILYVFASTWLIVVPAKFGSSGYRHPSPKWPTLCRVGR